MITSEPTSQRALLGVCGVIFAASVAATITGAASMSAMGDLPMPGGWTLSTAWIPICGQSWAGCAGSFLGMWLVMMAAMMLPSLVPILMRYREAVGATGKSSLAEPRLGRLTALVGAGYFLMWTLLGIAVFAVGAASASVAMQWPALARAVPSLGAAIVLMAGVSQFSAWKSHHLFRCRQAPSRSLSADAATALRHGVRLGLHCIATCAGLTATLLIIGVMDLRAMAVVKAAITIERFAPAGERVARTIGAVVIGVGVLLMARAGGL
jgi:predicted metal-binding membrane protein